jgi:soluble P-type ATPase
MAILIPLPGETPIQVQHLALDFTGTLSKDGRLLPGVAERVHALSGRVRIVVMTADTRGTARNELAGFPVELHLVADGAEKARLARGLGPAGLAAIGNGRNDVALLALAALGIAVLGAEGTAAELIRVARVVAPEILTALDLLIEPQRLTATLRA